MPEVPHGRLLIGAKALPTGRLDTSHALFLYPDSPQFGEKTPPVPDKWTMLIHGTHTGRHRGNTSLLDRPVYVIDPKASGMSCLTADQVDAQRKTGYDTIAGYGMSGKEDITRVEIATLFPNLHPYNPTFKERVAALAQRYGEETASKLEQLAQTVYLRNEQVGSHPLLPRGMVLIKLADRTTDGVRKVFYVPHQLYEIYQQEIQNQAQPENAQI